MSAGTDIKPWRERIDEEGTYRHTGTMPNGVVFSDCVNYGDETPIFAADQEIAELRAALEAAEHQRSMLAQAIADASKKAGIWNGEVSLTGPHLIMFADNLADCAIAQPDSGRDAALESGMYVSVEGSSVEWGPDVENWCMDIPGDAPLLDKVATAIRHANQYVADNGPVVAQQGEKGGA